MGQQQLLLIVLSTIIVGVSIVVGINMFGQGALQANNDAIVQDVLTIASRGQQWFRKPTTMGGGGRSYATISMANIGVSPTNENGAVTITSPNDSSFTINATGTEGGNATVIVFADSVGALAIN